ncbi:MAG TPA: hypothetical protein VE218_05805 [Acidobacteriaceae bacterium]|nr:hypothetical protein [Acidobacteriaceae bacterium]
MKLRIAIWTAAGALVVVFWSFYLSATHLSRFAPVWTFVDLTMPIALARHYHVAMSVNVVLLVNAATYALMGTVVESMWRHYKHRHPLTSLGKPRPFAS